MQYEVIKDNVKYSLIAVNEIMETRSIPNRIEHDRLIDSCEECIIGYRAKFMKKKSKGSVNVKLLKEIDGLPVLDISDMFSGISDIELNVFEMDTRNVLLAERVFYNMHNKKIDIRNWNTRSLKKVIDMFYGIDCEELDLSRMDFSSVEYAEHMFSYSKIRRLNLEEVDFSNLEQTRGMFVHCECNSIDFSTVKLGNIYDTTYMFKNCLADKIILSNELFERSDGAFVDCGWIISGTKALIVADDLTETSLRKMILSGMAEVDLIRLKRTPRIYNAMKELDSEGKITLLDGYTDGIEAIIGLLGLDCNKVVILV